MVMGVMGVMAVMAMTTHAPVSGFFGGSRVNGLQGQFWPRDHLGVHDLAGHLCHLCLSRWAGLGMLVWGVR